MERRLKLFSARSAFAAWWPDPIHRQLVELLWRSMAVAAFTLGLELVIRAGDPVRALEPEPHVASEFLLMVLGTFAIPIAVLVGIWSVAIVALGAYADPALLLLHRLYPRGVQRVMAFVSGRYNPFYRALFYSTALLLSLIALLVADRLGISAPLLPSLAVIAVLIVLDALSLLFFIFWVLRLTRASETIAATWEMGTNLLSHIERVGRNGRLTPLRRRPVSDDLHLATEEQEEFRACLRAIVVAGVRAASSEQTVAAFQSARALRALSEQHLRLVAGDRAPDDWLATVGDGDDFVMNEILTGFDELLRVAGRNGMKGLEYELGAELEAIARQLDALAERELAVVARARGRLERASRGR